MKCDKQNMLLYAVTDRAWVGKQSLYEQVESALKGGVTCVQLREKELDDEAFLKEAVEIHALCQRYGVPFFVNNYTSGSLLLSALQAGTICLALNCGAYMSEIIRAGIQSVDVGQMEAARSLGLPYWRAMYRVVMPQAIKTMIPSIINQFIITLKDTSILSIIGFPELINAAKNVNAVEGKVFEIWAIVGVMYLIVISILSIIAKRLERRLNAGRERG